MKPKIQPINLSHPSKRLYFLIHGYTGSPTDFNGLPEHINKNCEANVKVMLLPGHGTRIEDLDNVRYKDFVRAVEEELNEDIKKYDEVIIGGVSFGAQLALIMGSRYPAKGVFNICVPYKLRFPFNIPGISVLGHFKKYWPKFIPEEQLILRKDAFHYKQVHINGLKIVKLANKDVRHALPQITCPTITIYSQNDRIGNYESFKKMERKIKAPHVKAIFDEEAHNIFFSNKRLEVYEKIVDFFKNPPEENEQQNT